MDVEAQGEVDTVGKPRLQRNELELLGVHVILLDLLLNLKRIKSQEEKTGRLVTDHQQKTNERRKKSHQLQLLGHHHFPLPDHLRQGLLLLCETPQAKLRNDLQFSNREGCFCFDLIFEQVGAPPLELVLLDIHLLDVGGADFLLFQDPLQPDLFPLCVLDFLAPLDNVLLGLLNDLNHFGLLALEGLDELLELVDVSGQVPPLFIEALQ